jgi:hypothetical protein
MSARGDIVSSQPPADIQALIDRHMTGFNTQDDELHYRLHSDVYVRKRDGLWKIEAQAWGRTS